jgi:SNF2 family DNA or RNA helicase
MRYLDELRLYQQRIATHLYENDAALCVLRPGGGKTIAALTAIVEMLDQNVIRHALIIAPKRVARVVWPDEIAEWAHTVGLRCVVLDGSPAMRAAQLLTTEQRDLTIVGLDIVPWVMETIRLHPPTDPIWDLLIIDEISRLRNPAGVRLKALSKQVHRWRSVWGLSGTLRPNSALDLFAPVRVVTKGALWGKSYYAWRGKHFYPIDYNGYDWRPLPGAENNLNRDIAPLTLMVPEDEIPKIEPTIVIDKVELPATARVEYERMQRTLVAKTDKDEVVAGSAAIATGKLAQIANGFLYEEEEDETLPVMKSRHVVCMHNEKREWLADLAHNATEPLLIIYEYLADLEMLREELGEDLPHIGAGVPDREAARYIERWNNGELKRMALHPAAGGHGLNLQHGGADMAWLNPTWSPEFWEQTIARLARPGQKRPVVVRVCVANDTVDELKLSRVHGKMSAQAAFEAWLQRWHAAPMKRRLA